MYLSSEYSLIHASCTAIYVDNHMLSHIVCSFIEWTGFTYIISQGPISYSDFSPLDPLATTKAKIPSRYVWVRLNDENSGREVTQKRKQKTHGRQDDETERDR